MKNSSLVLLSGEGTSIPEAEARAVFLAYDPDSEFSTPSSRLLIARSSADPFLVGSRIAFARRVGILLEDQAEARSILKGRRVRFRPYKLSTPAAAPDPAKYLRGVDATIDLSAPEYELTLVRAAEEYLAVTSPTTMKQGWSKRRPRKRSFFHPSAVFPKLSRALVNLSRCREGDLFLDPFAGTGSIPLEAYIVGARVIAADLSEEMARGSLSNMKQFAQGWVGVLRADATAPPLAMVDAIATDVPYGRASSTRGRGTRELVDSMLSKSGGIMKRSSCLVLMHPQQIEVEGTAELSVIEEHHLHVHKLLTRTITVLKRR